MDLQVPSDDEIVAMSPADREAWAREVDGVRRRAEAAMATFVHRVEHTGTFAADGHRSAKAWGRAACNWSGGEATRLVKCGRTLARFPSAAAAAADGLLGVAQLHALGQLVSNPRISEHLDAAQDVLVSAAQTLDFDDYITMLAQWEAVADADGAHRGHERAHHNRNAQVAIVGDRVYLDAVGGVAPGVGMIEIFEQFCRSAWLTDWEEGKLRYGDQMDVGLMARTDGQRRFDALWAIFRAAAASGQLESSEPVVNLIVGYELFQHHLQRALGQSPPPLDPSDPAHRCETDSGVLIDPADMLVAAALGHVRRVVLDSAGVVIDVGRKQRLFTGALREAVMLLSRRCIWPGCYRPTSQCEADHVLPFANAGPTAAHNGSPNCGHHNRWKTRGYRTWRDPQGHWHHYRPDHTEMGWRAA